MATVQVSNDWSTRVLDPHSTRGRGDPGLSRLQSFAQILGHVGRQLLGAVLLLFGGAMVFTLWLIPVGLPLMLFGLALLAAPQDV